MKQKNTKWISKQKTHSGKSYLNWIKTNNKEKFLKGATEIEKREMKIIYRRIKTKIMAETLSETMQARRQVSDIFRLMKENNCQPTILYPVKIYFNSKINIRIFQKKTTREFSAVRPNL